MCISSIHSWKMHLSHHTFCIPFVPSLRKNILLGSFASVTMAFLHFYGPTYCIIVKRYYCQEPYPHYLQQLLMVAWLLLMPSFQQIIFSNQEHSTMVEWATDFQQPHLACVQIKGHNGCKNRGCWESNRSWHKSSHWIWSLPLFYRTWSLGRKCSCQCEL